MFYTYMINQQVHFYKYVQSHIILHQQVSVEFDIQRTVHRDIFL